MSFWERFTRESASFIDEREGTVTFAAARPRPVGSTAKLRFPLTGSGKMRKLDLDVRVLHSRPVAGGKSFVCSGPVHVPSQSLTQVSQLLRSHAPRPAEPLPTRREPRLPAVLKVSGRELPAYTGMLADVSLSGARLVCQGEVPLGKPIQLLLETDYASVRQVQVEARAVWCRSTEGGRSWSAGFQFLGTNAQQLRGIQLLCEALQRRAADQDVQRLQIVDVPLPPAPSSESTPNGNPADASGQPRLEFTPVSRPAAAALLVKGQLAPPTTLQPASDQRPSRQPAPSRLMATSDIPLQAIPAARHGVARPTPFHTASLAEQAGNPFRLRRLSRN